MVEDPVNLITSADTMMSMTTPIGIKPEKFAVTVDEHMLVKYTRYKYYDMPEDKSLPDNWEELSTDDKYNWINENCHFRTMEDYAEEYDSECQHDEATEVEMNWSSDKIVWSKEHPQGKAESDESTN